MFFNLNGSSAFDEGSILPPSQHADLIGEKCFISCTLELEALAQFLPIQLSLVLLVKAYRLLSCNKMILSDMRFSCRGWRSYIDQY